MPTDRDSHNLGTGDGQFATFFGGENRRSETVRLTDRPSERFVGALRTVVYHATWGLAALSVYPSRVRIAGGFRPVNLLVPVWEAGFNERAPPGQGQQPQVPLVVTPGTRIGTAPGEPREKALPCGRARSDYG